MITLAVANNKGGVGKTTTAYWLGRCLAEMGHGVTLIDLDPQGNLTAALGVDEPETIADVLRGNLPLLRAIADVDGQLAIVPARADLADIADDLTIKPLGVLRLRSALEDYAAIVDPGEIVLIDCPPNVGALTYSALIAADAVIIPTQPAAWSFEGVGRIVDKVAEVHAALGRSPSVLGVIATLVDGRVGDHRAQVAAMATGKLPVLGQVPRREGKDAEEILHAAYEWIAAAVAHRLGVA